MSLGLVVIVGAATRAGSAIARGLSERGRTVTLIGTADDNDEVVAVAADCRPAALAVRGELDTVAAATAAYESAASARGRVGAVVHAWAPPTPSEPTELTALTDHDWQRRAELPLHTALHSLEGAMRAFGEGPGSIVFVIPTIGLSGCRHFAPDAAAAEAVRGLAKSAARQLGRQGLRVNCLAVGSAWAEPGIAALTSKDNPQPPRSVPHGEGDSQLTGVIQFLVSDDSAGLTGATLCVDGGRWFLA